MSQKWEDERVSWGKRASYSMGFFYNYITGAAISFLIFRYYEVEIGLSVFLVGLALVIFALWNMINDPLIGFLTDKPMRWSKKYGLRLPWILFGGILTIIFFFLLFTVPTDDVKSNPWPTFWYLVIITCIYDTFFTIYSTHYAGGFTNIFRTRDDRRKGGTIGQWMGTVGRFIMLGIIIPSIIVTGDPASYTRAALITSVILAISLVIFIPGIYESEAVKARYFKVHEYLESVKLPYFKFLKITMKQKNYMISLIAFTMFNISFNLYYASSLYFVEDVLQEGMEVVALAAIAYTLGFCISIFLWSRFVADRFGHRNTYALGLALLGICYLAAMWYTTVIEYVVWHFIAGVGMSGFSAVFMSIGADTNDEVTNACGRHQEASLGGIQNFFFRFSLLVMGFVIALTHILTGYVPHATEQTELAKLGIRINVGLIPGLVCLLGGFLMYKYYDLIGDKRVQLMASLREKGL
ncbi:MAG: MFS transporter [Promethearchaeota archaeon]